MFGKSDEDPYRRCDQEIKLICSNLRIGVGHANWET